MKKIISFMHLLLDGFVADQTGEMNRMKVDEGSILFHAKTPRSKVAKYFLASFFNLCAFA